MNRKVVVALGIVGVAMLGGASMAYSHRASRAADHAIARVVALDLRPPVRQAFKPVPGTLRTLLEPKLQRDLKPEPGCGADVEGAACHTAWENDRVWALDVLQASRAEKWVRVPGIHDHSAAVASRAMGRLEYALQLGAHELGQRSPETGVEICVDGFALVRDVALGNGLSAERDAAALHALYAKRCGPILATAPQVKELLAAVQQGWPSVGEWVGYEMFDVVQRFHPVLSPTQLARVPSVPLPLVSMGGVFDRWKLGNALPLVVSTYERFEQVARLSPDKRDGELEKLEAGLRQGWGPLREVPQGELTGFFAREDARRDELKRIIDAMP
ncbi:MAG: hypothetical protein IPJ65_38805 [Archangiaceae bacterium]|nr:hypothetical protein [Archangiaceae bacterium]